MDLFDKIHTQVDCSSQYDFSGPTVSTIVLNIFLVILTILLEIVVHCSFTFKSSKRNPKYKSLAEDEPREDITTSQYDAEAPIAAKKPAWSPLNNNPSPAIRKTRLIAATILFIPVIVLFTLRLTWALHPDVRSECLRYIDPGWPFIIIFGIGPFIVSCFAWLRALVDYILIGFNKSLTYQVGRWFWPPCAPLFLPHVIVMGTVILIGWGLKKSAMFLLGMIGWTIGIEEDEEEIQLRSEEELGLMAGVDADVPPAYEETCEETRRDGDIV